MNMELYANKRDYEERRKEPFKKLASVRTLEEIEGILDHSDREVSPLYHGHSLSQGSHKNQKHNSILRVSVTLKTPVYHFLDLPRLISISSVVRIFFLYFLFHFFQYPLPQKRQILRREFLALSQQLCCDLCTIFVLTTALLTPHTCIPQIEDFPSIIAVQSEASRNCLRKICHFWGKGYFAVVDTWYKS